MVHWTPKEVISKMEEYDYMKNNLKGEPVIVGPTEDNKTVEKGYSVTMDFDQNVGLPVDNSFCVIAVGVFVCVDGGIADDNATAVELLGNVLP